MRTRAKAERARAVMGLAIAVLLLAVPARAAGTTPFAPSVSDLPWQPTAAVAKANVLQFKYQGRDWDHPTQQAQQGLNFVGSFVLSGDSEYLSLAERNARYLLYRSTRVGSALWFSFPFTWDKGAPELMRAPWYSGLTQGKALGLFSRLYGLTSDPRWKAAADGVFASYLAPRSSTAPWFSRTLPDGSTWFEEYPDGWPSDRILNGNIGAIFGLWDYWRISRDPVSTDLLARAIASVKRELPSYEVPGEYSYYGLRFHAQKSGYHRAHEQQLRQLAAISGDSFFADEADLFGRDATAYEMRTRWLPALVLLCAVGLLGWRLRRVGRRIARGRTLPVPALAQESP
jgi:hypothetical protein